MATKPVPLSLTQARTYRKKGMNGYASRLFQKAAASNEKNHLVQFEASAFLGERFEFSEMERCLERVLAASPSPEEKLQVAQLYMKNHREERAIEILDGTEPTGKLAGFWHFSKARLFERTQHLERALEAVNLASEALEGRPEVSLLSARLLRRSGEGEQARETLEQVLNQKVPRPEIHAEAYGEKSLAADKEGDFESAWEANERSKKLLQGLPFAKKLAQQSLVNSRTLSSLYEGLTAADLSSWRQQPGSPLDERVFGVGHLLGFPRTGTTLLEQVLDSHPDVVSSQERAVFSKEIFMSMYRATGRETMSLSSLQKIPADRLQSHRQRYWDAMEEALNEPLGGRFHIDKNPNQTSLMAGLFRLLPESKFLVALRDPRDVVVSCYLRFFPLSEFSASFLTPGSTCFLYSFEMGIWLRMRELLESNEWKEVRYEETVADVEKQSRDVLQFLGIEWSANVLAYRELLKSKRVNSPTHSDVRKPIYQASIGRWKNYEKWLAPYFERLEKVANSLGYSF